MVSAAALVILGLVALHAGARASSMVRTRLVLDLNRVLFVHQSYECLSDSRQPLEGQGLSSSRRRRELWKRLLDPRSHHLLYRPWLDPANPPAWLCPRTLSYQWFCVWRLVSTAPPSNTGHALTPIHPSCAIFWCNPCALTQESREIELEEESMLPAGQQKH
jgi:hypothetical protein